MEKLTSILVVVEGAASGTKILEKAMVLARGFGARVDLMLCDTPDMKAFATLCQERGYDEVVLCSVFRSAEPLADAILRRVHETSPDMVVKALTLPHGAAGFDRDDQYLAAACPVPLLLMRDQRWRSPVRIAGAVDVSGENAALARSILHTSGFLSLGLEGELDVFYSEREQQDEVMRMAHAVKLARLVREFHVDGERLRHIDGAPEETLPPIAASGDHDVLVLGALTQRHGFSTMHATLTRKLVEACTGDVMLIKEEERTAPVARQVPLRFRATSSPRPAIPRS